MIIYILLCVLEKKSAENKNSIVAKKNSMFHNTEFEKKLTYYYLYDKNGIVYILLCIFEKKVFKTHKKKDAEP